jgi:hypothetical protein
VSTVRTRIAGVGAAGSAVLALGLVGASPAGAATPFDQYARETVTLQDTSGGSFTCALYWDQFGYDDATAYARAIIESGDARCTSTTSTLRVTSSWVDGDGDTRRVSSTARATASLSQSLEDAQRSLRSDYVFSFGACNCSVTRTLTQPK